MERSELRGKRKVSFWGWKGAFGNLSRLTSWAFDEASAAEINRDALEWDAKLANQRWSQDETVTINEPFFRELVGSMGASNRQALAKILQECC